MSMLRHVRVEESEWGAVLSCQQLDCFETLLTTALLPSGSDSGVLRKCIIFIEKLKKITLKFSGM